MDVANDLVAHIANKEKAFPAHAGTTKTLSDELHKCIFDGKVAPLIKTTYEREQRLETYLADERTAAKAQGVELILWRDNCQKLVDQMDVYQSRLEEMDSAIELYKELIRENFVRHD